jgi:hypothetical protein
MFKFKELTFLASLFIVGMLLLAACGAEEPTPATVEEAIDTQATVEAAETEASVEAEEAAQATLEAADSASAAESEESGVTNTESSSENQVPISKSEVPRISVEELKERLDNGEEIVVVDSRGKSSYDFMHIAGAISVPSVNVESPLDEMALDQEIVLYCA